jgi:hypothetical protein
MPVVALFLLKVLSAPVETDHPMSKIIEELPAFVSATIPF